MSGINYDEILKTIAEANKPTENNNAKNFLKTDIIGNSITGRFIPNLKNVAASIFSYGHHGWNSKIDNTGLFYICLNSFKEKCPICSRSINMWKSNDPIQKETSKSLRRRNNFLVNFYVISDIKHPENNGTLKMLRYGQQIDQKIQMATTGDDKEIYGSKIWRLDEQGCNFRIKCEQNSKSAESWPTYTNSGFLPPSKIEGMTDARISEILGNVFDLPTQFTRRTANELVAEMNKHFFINEINDAQTTISLGQTTVGLNEEKTTTTQSNVSVAGSNSKPTPDGVSENQLDQMLAELQ